MTTTFTLFETIQRIVREELRSLHTAELAIVQEQHPHASDSDKDNYACTVVLRNSGIVLKNVPVATPHIGSASLPAVGDLVLVQFISGDLNAPVITGSLYSDEARPPVNDANQMVWHLPLGASPDDAIQLTVQSGDSREVSFTLGSGLELNLKDDDPVVTLTIDGGKATLQIDRDGAVTLESQGDLTLKGNAVTIEGQSQLDLKGGTVNIKGQPTVNIN
jgi:uncharacterized protein involved in type VI secretion and phage assembly